MLGPFPKVSPLQTRGKRGSPEAGLALLQSSLQSRAAPVRKNSSVFPSLHCLWPEPAGCGVHGIRQGQFMKALLRERTSCGGLPYVKFSVQGNLETACIVVLPLFGYCLTSFWGTGRLRI